MNKNKIIIAPTYIIIKIKPRYAMSNNIKFNAINISMFTINKMEKIGLYEVIIPIEDKYIRIYISILSIQNNSI